MVLAFIYWPFLIFAPLLLVVGVVFVVVPGGFMIVLGGVYFAFAGLMGLLGTTVRERLPKGKAQVRLEPTERLSTARTARQAQRA
jgi:predicted Co/Zn/Cd cation transporter (cation efflux family)